MFESVQETFSGVNARFDIPALRDAYASSNLLLCTASVRTDRMISIPLALLDTVPEGEVLYVICESRHSARATYEDIHYYSSPEDGVEHLGVLFRARLTMDHVAHPKNRMVVVSSDYAARTGLINSIRYAVVEYGESASAATISCVIKLREMLLSGEDMHVALPTITPLTDPEFWKGITVTSISEKDSLVSPPSPARLPEESISQYASRLIRTEQSKGILVICPTRGSADDVYGDFVSLLVSGILPNLELQVLPKQMHAAIKQQLKEVTLTNPRVLIAVGNASGIPYTPWLDTIISLGTENEIQYADTNRRSVQLKPISRAALVRQQGLLPNGKGLFINLCTEVAPEERPHSAALSYLSTYLAQLNLKLTDVVTGYKPYLQERLGRPIGQLKQFGMITEDPDKTLHQSLDGMMSLGEVNLTIRAAVALAQALREDILGVAFPYISLLAKNTYGHLGFKIPNGSHTWCDTSDPINAMCVLLTENYHRSRDGCVSHSVHLIDCIRRVVGPKGFGCDFDFDAWVSKDRIEPPRVISDPLLFKKMKSVILRSHCDQFYAVKDARAILSYEDSVPFSSRSAVTSNKAALGAVGVLAPIVLPDSDTSFVVLKNITMYSEEEFSFAHKWYTPTREFLKSVFNRCDWEYVEERLREGR